MSLSIEHVAPKPRTIEAMQRRETRYELAIIVEMTKGHKETYVLEYSARKTRSRLYSLAGEHWDIFAKIYVHFFKKENHHEKYSQQRGLEFICPSGTIRFVATGRTERDVASEMDLITESKGE